MRKPIKTKKTTWWIAGLSTLFLVFLILYIAVLMPMQAADTEAGSSSTLKPVQPEDGEGVGITVNTLLMYPRVERSGIASIEVFNRYDEKSGTYSSYKFVRDTEDKDLDGDVDDFIIDGYPANTYSEEKFSLLVVDTGYTACLGKLDLDFTGLDDAGVDDIYSRYGLSPSQHPTYFRMTERSGTVRTVYIGTQTVDGNYYARLDGRNAVYVLYASMEDSVLAPLSFFVDPTLTFAADTQYGYVYIRNFAVFHDRTLIDMVFGNPEENPDIDAGKLSPFVMFTYLPAADRDLFHANSVYAMLAPSDFYTANDSAVDGALVKLPGLTGVETLQLGLSDRDFAEGGLLADVAYTFYYEMPYDITYDVHGEPQVGYWVKNILFVTRLGADNTYTIGSLSYTDEEDSLFLNMIAKVAYEDFSFAEYTLFDWIQEEVMAVNIDNVASLAFSSWRGDYMFDIFGDGSSGQSVTERNTGYHWVYKGRDYPFEVNEQGYCEDISQFRQLYMLLLTLDYGGDTASDAGLSEEEMEQIMQDDSNCLLTFTLTMEDGRVITYRFYPYSERHAMVSVTGDGIRPTTEFYTSSAAVRRIANATRDLMTGVEIDPDHRYG